MTRPATEQHQVCDCGSCGPRNDDTATTGRGGPHVPCGCDGGAAGDRGCTCRAGT